MGILDSLFAKPEPESTLHRLFEKQTRLTPKAIAICDGEKTLTYTQLNEMANQNAHLLVESGVKQGDVVGLCMDQSDNQIAMLIAILKCGAAYLPLDPAWPRSRIDYICRDAGVDVVFSSQQLGLESDEDFTVVYRERAESYPNESLSLYGQQSGDCLACVLYTSGSTGEPKGVEICHKGLVNVIQYRLDSILGGKEGKVVPLTATLDFDASVAQIFTPLCCGGKLLVVENIFSLSQSACFEEITCIGSTPSVVKAFLENHTFPNSLKVLLLGGEDVDENLCRTIWNKTKVKRLINLYGPTEATVHVTCSTLFERKRFSRFERSVNFPITIGKPIGNNDVHILDEELSQCEIGDPGEIYLTGIGLARSYRNNSSLTAQKFIEIDLQGDRVRAYKTGDLGVVCSNGEVRFLGRKDRQVKVYGYRIELDEIEAKLKSHSLVKDCAVEACDEASTKSIVAYVVFNKNTVIADDDLVKKLRKDLRDLLPVSMQPREYKVLEKLPLTDRGKVDRASLTLA